MRGPAGEAASPVREPSGICWQVLIPYARIPDLASHVALRWLDSELRVVLYLAYGWLVYRLGGSQGLLWGFCLSPVLLWNISHVVQSFSHAIRQGHVWWEIDVTDYLLKALSWAGLVWDLRRFERSPGA